MYFKNELLNIQVTLHATVKLELHVPYTCLSARSDTNKYREKKLNFCDVSQNREAGLKPWAVWGCLMELTLQTPLLWRNSRRYTSSDLEPKIKFVPYRCVPQHEGLLVHWITGFYRRPPQCQNTENRKLVDHNKALVKYVCYLHAAVKWPSSASCYAELSVHTLLSAQLSVELSFTSWLTTLI